MIQNKKTPFALLMLKQGLNSKKLLIKIEDLCESNELKRYFKKDFISPIAMSQISCLKLGKIQCWQISCKNVILLSKALDISLDDLLKI